MYHLPLSQTIILASWALHGKEASKAYGLPTEASTITCYDLDSVLSKRHTLILSNTRELDRVPTTI